MAEVGTDTVVPTKGSSQRDDGQPVPAWPVSMQLPADSRARVGRWAPACPQPM